jgi:hypothetical protein
VEEEGKELLGVFTNILALKKFQPQHESKNFLVGKIRKTLTVLINKKRIK